MLNEIFFITRRGNELMFWYINLVLRNNESVYLIAMLVCLSILISSPLQYNNFYLQRTPLKIVFNSLTSKENGDINEKRSGGCFVGFLYKIVIPKFMNGLVKSTAFCRPDVIVKSVIAKSTLWKETVR